MLEKMDIPKSINELSNYPEECTKNNLKHYLMFPKFHKLADHVMQKMIDEHTTDITLLSIIPAQSKLADHLIYDTELESILLGECTKEFEEIIIKILKNEPSYMMMLKLYNITNNKEKFIQIAERLIDYRDFNEFIYTKCRKKGVIRKN